MATITQFRYTDGQTRTPGRFALLLFIGCAFFHLALTNTATAATEIAQFGITWTFDKNYTVGQFANGDYWVIGPVNIISIDPCSFVGDGLKKMTGQNHQADWTVASGREVNGSMINPVPGDSQGYDSADFGTHYQRSLNVAWGVNDVNVLTLPAGTSLVSTISLDPTVTIGGSSTYGKTRLWSGAILTVLASAPDANSFRPPYCGTDKTIDYNETDLNYGILASLSGTGIRTATGAATHLLALHKDTLSDPNMQYETVERYFERPWILHYDPGGYKILPATNMWINYGKNRADCESAGAMMLQLDFTNAQKKTLYIRMVQLGIDYYGIVTNGTGKHVFTEGAGTCVGGKFPIILAGLALNDADMKAIGEKSGDYLLTGERGDPPDDYIHFTEDNQTFYVTAADVCSVPYAANTYGTVRTQTGTLTVVNGNATVTGVGTSWLSNGIDTTGPDYDWLIVVGSTDASDPNGHAYRIASVDDNTHITLNRVYLGESTSGLSYKIAAFAYYAHANYTKESIMGIDVDYHEFVAGDINWPAWGMYHATVPLIDGKETLPSLLQDYQAISSDTMCGYVLATRIMGGKTVWNHNALFDYTDRWMSDMTGADRAAGDFIEDMWDTYRADYGPIWPDTEPPVSEPNNHAPVLGEIGNKSVDENALLTFTTVSATDPDGDTVTYSASGLPAGATFSSPLTWTPGYDQAGTYNVTFVATDEHGAQSSPQTVTITVNNVNRPPVLAAIGSKSVNEGSLLSFSLSATDADGDTVTYTANSLPAGSAFAGSTFAWTPGYTQAGSFQVTFTASDGHTQDSETVTITINNTNRAPVFDAIPDKSVNENALLTFEVSATDPDGDPLSYSATGLPSGATFAGQTFSWTPSSSQADSSHQVTFIAGDGQLDDSQIVTITVTDTLAPSVTNLSPAAGSIQALLNSLIVLHVTDAGTGVNAGTVTITLDGRTIYSGDTSNYVSATSNCRRTGTAADYTYAYQSSQSFDFDQTMTVAVNATDLAGNVMSEQAYSFRTEMRSFGQNKLLSSDIEGLDKGAPATARDSSGNIWAVWHAGPAGSRDIYLAKLTAGSTSFGTGTQITTDASDQCNPAVALGTDDKLYVVWQDNRRGNWDVYASTLSSLGTTWSAQQRITDSNDNQINPAIAIDRQSPNRAHVAWQDDRAGNQDIYIATSSNSFVTNTITKITSDTSNQITPAIAVDSSNTVYVLWTDARNSSKDIYGAAGSSWTNVPVVTKAADQSSPAIAVESAGSVLHILWVDQTSGSSDIYYASSNGLPSSPLTGTNLIDDTSGAEQTSPAIAVTGSTGISLKVFACWADERNISGGAVDTDIYMVQANAGSGTNVLISNGSTNSNQTEPATCTDQYGYPYTVWTDDRGANTEIYFAASTFMQSSALASQLITPASGGTVGTDPSAITGPDDASVVAPAGACPYDVTISITKIENPQEFATRQLSSYDFGPSGIEFSRPVTITIPYAVASSGTSPSAYWYDSLTGALSQQGITDIEIIELSTSLHALRFKTTHFTPYVVLAAAATAGAAGGGGGGGGGCSMSPHQGAEWLDGQSNAVEFLVPYLGLAVVMLVLKLRDARNRRARNAAKR